MKDRLFTYFNNLKLKKKLYLAFAVVSSFFILAQIWTFANIIYSTSKLSEIITTTETEAYISDCRINHFKWVLANNHYIQGIEDSYNIKSTADSCCVGKWLASTDRKRIENRFPKTLDQIKQVEKVHKIMHKASQETQLAYDIGNFEEAKNLFTNQIEKQHKKTDKLFGLIVEELKTETNKDEITERGKFIIISVLLILGIVILIVMLITKLFVKQTLIPLNKMTALASKLAKGDLRETIKTTRKDEYGELTIALNLMVGKVREVIANAVDATNNFAAASLEMSNNAQTISEGASKQAASAEEVSAAMDQMLANIEQNSMNAQETKKITSATANKMKVSNSIVQKTAEMVRQIVRKIRIIDDISFQTNILALNASIEAHKAGQEGRGFGVVASEVGNLAERSKVSAAEIEDLSTKSFDISVKASTLIDALVPELESTAKLVMEIAMASSEQDSGAKQVNASIIELNEVTQKNAAAAEEMSTTAQELSSQATTLQELIAFFKVT